jgi:signal transduction histidine kinase
VEIVLDAAVEQPTPAFVITVRDHGSGIGPENLEKVFDPFFTTGRSKGGTGLGLSIVRNIVTGALKGTITVDSTPGEGTTFHVRFPQEAVHV